MLVRELAGDGQPKSATASSAAAGCFEAMKWAKYGLCLIAWNAWPTITNFYRNAGTIASQIDVDHRAASVVSGVFHQIDQQTVQRHGIGAIRARIATVQFDVYALTS